MRNASVFCLLSSVLHGAAGVRALPLVLAAVVGATALPTFGSVRRIDLSSYFVSTNYLNCVGQRAKLPMYSGGVLAATSGQTFDLAKPCAGGLSFGDGLTNLAARVVAMDAAGVDTALLSSFVQVWDLPEADAIRVARESNNDIARAMKAYPGRFEGAALLPIVAGSDTCVAEALAELDRCVNELGFKVWIAASNFGADHLYDAKFEPLLKRASELGVAIYLQDAYPIEEPFAALDGQDDPNAWGPALCNGQDLMVTTARLVMNGTFDRHPALRVILPNLGEYLPFNLDRMSSMLGNFEDPANIQCKKTLFHYAVTNRNFILTTSGSTNEIPFACAKRVMGADTLCFGTGWPFEDAKAHADAIASFNLTDAERDGIWGDNVQKCVFKSNPMMYFRDRDAAAYSSCVHSLKNVQQGELYTMRWADDADYHMDEMLGSGCSTSIGMLEWLCKNVLNDAPPPPPVTDLGCSAFAATNALGQQLAERNFDYRYRMTHALVYVPRSKKYNRPFASVSTVDCGWVGYDIGGLDDGTNDLSYAALFPHIPLDGMNDQGLMVTVLSLDARTNGHAMTEQYFPDRTNIVTTVAIRYLLDNADSTESGIHMLTNNFNMFQAIGGDIPISANYHFYLCDKSGDTRVVEWLPPTDGSRSWTAWVTNATAVSNFYFYDGYGHGSNRWEIMRHALARQDGHLEEPDAMHLARAVAQHKGAEQTSWTHWSIVYNLADLTAQIATLGNYDEIFPYRLDLEAPSDWTTEAPKSARPAVETNLPPFEATAEPRKVYRLANPIIPDSSGTPSSYAGASVPAVNRLGLTYDATNETLHAVATNAASAKCRAVFYVDMSLKDPGMAARSIVAGVSEKGFVGRVMKFKNSTGPGERSPSETLLAVLNNSETFKDALKMMEAGKQSEGGCGFVLSDAMGNVAVWGPKGAELETDDAFEMVRNSLDLRKGIYETDGDGRGQFDELPGLMRLASTADTKAIVSMGYGHLDVMLPNSNVLWRAELEDVSVPVYGVVAEPPAVAHATATLTYTNGDAVAVNNQGRLVAETNAMLRVVYAADSGYCFADGAKSWTRDFSVGATVTTPPAPGRVSICPRDPDYAEATGRDWLFNHAIAGKACPDEAAESDVDLFYVYPTLVGNEQIVFDGFRGIDDAAMRDTATNMTTAVGAYCNTARCFAEMMHVYAPFYRQSTLDTATDCATNAAGGVVADANAKYLAKLCEGPAYGDVTNALTTYFAKWNKGRKLMLAAHSQGSAVLRLVMENYFTLPENRDKAKLIICSYQIGFGIGQSSIDKITAANGMKFAEKADDTNVIVSYNTMAEGSSGNSILLPADTLAINPITWTRGTDLADKSLNLGALTNDMGQADVIVPGLYSAQVVDTGANRGKVVVCKELNSRALPPNLFGTGSLHAQDDAAYWENLRANVYDRGGNLAGFAKLCTTNFPKHLCVSNATVNLVGKSAFDSDPVAGTVWIPTNGLGIATVRLVPEKGYRLLWEGEETPSVAEQLTLFDLQSDGTFKISDSTLAMLTVEWIQRAPDYADETGKDWLFHHDITAKRYEGEPSQDPGVDLFYLYPTSAKVSNDHTVDGICDIDDEYLRSEAGALDSWNMSGKVFGDFTRVYAPYYRQTPLDVEMTFTPMEGCWDKMTKYWYERAPYTDVTNALTHYFTKINPNGERPFVFAGHSHGSGMLILAMEHFFKDHQQWLGNMVACYAVGMGVSEKWEGAVKEYAPIATNATDAGVYVFWNTEGAGTSGGMTSGLWPTNHVPGVNPITWTRTGEYAPASLNVGGWTADDSGAVRPGLYDASNNVTHGTVVCSSPELAGSYIPVWMGFGEKSLHSWDYKLYWENIRANALQRIKTMKARLGKPDYDQIPLAGTPIDYGDPYNWVTNTGTTKPLDVLYVYPTMMLEGDSTVVPVTDAMKEKAYGNAYVGAASAFAEYANVFIPAYRQVNMAAVTAAQALYTEPRDFVDYLKGGLPRTDLFAALDYYFTNLNVNAKRPFVFAGHSQGSAMLKIAFEDYFRSNATRKGYLDNMVAAYALGYSFSQEWCETYGVPFATGETDSGVIIGWNTEGPDAQGRSFVIEDGALAINPMNWSTNLNAWAGTDPDATIRERTATNYNYAAGTQVLVSTNSTAYLNPAMGFGEKSLHSLDWSLWYEAIKENGFKRAYPPVTQGITLWLQNVYTNRFTVMCETIGELPDLRLQYGENHAMSVGMTSTNGLKDGTLIYKAELTMNGAEGATVPYRLAVGTVPIAGTEGSVRLWKNEEASFTCAVWGDNQEGVQPYDWGNDVTVERYRCITNMFAHMAKAKPDFGFTTGDLSSSADYDNEILPGELRGAADFFGSKIPYHLVWGNHDCNGTFFGEVYTNAVQRYFAPAASEEDGWFHLYRNDVLFIGVHWTWGKGDAEARYDAITNGVAKLLATDRAKKAKFRILVQHTPIFLEVYNVLPKVDWFGDTRLLDVAKAGGVDLVFSGHTHAYERIERDGLVQVVNGGMGYLDHGERWYNNYGSDTKVGGHQNTPFLWARQDPSSLIPHPSSLAPAQPVRMGCFQGYGMLSVEGDKLTYKAHAFNADGGYIGVADAFTITSKKSPSSESKSKSGDAILSSTSTFDFDFPIDNAAWAEYKRAVGEEFDYDPFHAHDPVVNVSKTEIERFCAALNAGTPGANYRLPTVKELSAIFGGNLARDVSEWTSDVDPNTGWCRILGGNNRAVDFTWCREFDKPAMASPDCHANYLGFRVVNAEPSSVLPSAMDQALAKLAEKVAAGETIAEVYQWSSKNRDIKDITSDWTSATPTAKYNYLVPVIFTGKGDLEYAVSKDISFGGGVAAPNATSLNFSHALKAQSNTVTVKGEFRGGIATDAWRFYLKCDALTLDNVTYRGQVFNAVTDDRTLNLVGTNDFSGAVMSVGLDSLLKDPHELFVTKLVAAEGDAMLWLRRLDFTTRGVAEEVLGTLSKTASFTVGENVTLVTSEDVLFGIKGATLAVDGALDAEGVDIAGHLLGLLPQEATVTGAGKLTTTHFGMCDKSTLNVGVPSVKILSSVPYRTYADSASGCNVKYFYRDPNYALASGKDWLFNHAIAGRECPDEASADSGVDLFYVYPTLAGGEKVIVDGFRGIDDETMRGTATNYATAVGAYCESGRCFADMTRVYAPFYRQATLDTATDCATNNATGVLDADANARYLKCLYDGPAYSDVTNALTTYFAKWNNGRKLVFAAHSQGSALLRLVMENYFTLPENRDKAKLIVCSYQIGFGIGRSSIASIGKATGVTFAQKADDTNVIVSYNTMSKETTDYSILLPSDTLAINPITWTRGADLADKSLNLGARTSVIGKPDVVEAHLYSAQVADIGAKRGEVVVCTELKGHEMAEDLFGPGSLHGSDYAAYWENLHGNCYDRIAAATGKAPCVGTPTDYSTSENWMSCPATADKPVDVFYLYPTCVPLANTALIGEIEEGMKASAQEHYTKGPSTFESYANVYAPYYRQGSMTALRSDFTPDGIQRFCSTHVVKTDVFAALDWYFANRNPGAARPFILASHSQGSANMKNVFEEYFAGEKASYTNSLVAAYILGYKITPDWCEKVGVPFATGEIDTGVVLTWNAEGPGATSDNFLTADPNQLAINPINWKTDTTEALKTDNLGSVITNAQGVLYNTGRPGVTGARLQAGRAGAVIVDDPATIPVGISPGFGTKSYHFEDWAFFRDNIGANGYRRYAAFVGLAEISTNNIPTVADTTWKVMADGAEPTVSPVDGKYYAPADAKEVQLVYTLDAARAAQGYYFANGTTTAPLAMKLEGGVWGLTATKAEIEAGTRMGKPTLKLGVVAQRYPWNGVVDVNYRATYWPAGRVGAVEVTVGETVTTNEFAVAGQGEIVGTAAIDLKTLFGETRGGATFKAVK